MFDLDSWQEIYHVLVSNRLRTLLTAFGVFWGIFLLIVMLGSGSGLQNGTLASFAGNATNSFFIWTQTTTKPYRGLPPGRSFEMTNEDGVAIRQQIPEVEVLAPRNQLRGFGGSNNVTHGRQAGAFSVMGDYPQIRQVQSLVISAGRFLNPFDLDERRKVAVIGQRVHEVLFEDGEDAIGDNIHINGVYFKVIGVFKSPRSGEQADREEQTIYIPFTTFQNAFNLGNEVGWFAVTSRADVPASVAEEKVLSLLKSRHQVAPEDQRAFGHFNLETEFNKISGLFQGIGLLIWIVGAGTLAAGAIGVSNIMLIIVRERTGEIGIRRALGATPLKIMGQVVLEAVFLTAVAGSLGLVAGVLTIEAVAALVAGAETGMFKSPGVSLDSALQALLIIMGSGMAAGLIPARRAIAVSTVDALRTE